MKLIVTVLKKVIGKNTQRVDQKKWDKCFKNSWSSNISQDKLFSPFREFESWSCIILDSLKSLENKQKVEDPFMHCYPPLLQGNRSTLSSIRPNTFPSVMAAKYRGAPFERESRLLLFWFIQQMLSLIRIARHTHTAGWPGCLVKFAYLPSSHLLRYNNTQNENPRGITI